MKPALNQTVGYVDADGKIKPGVITEIHSDNVVTIDHATADEKKKAISHTAHASYDPNKKQKISWHAVSDGNGAPAASTSKEK